MNAKTAKALRKLTRNSAANFNDNGYISGPSGIRWAPDYDRPLRPDGTLQQRPHEITGTLRNAPGTARSFYRTLKAIIRRVPMSRSAFA